MQKMLVFFLIFILSLMAILPALAEDTVTDTVDDVVEQVISESAEVTAEDLDIPKPDRFSWLRRFGRNIRIAFTRDEFKKSELELKNAAEDLYRAKLLGNKNLTEEEIQAKIEQINQKYQAKIEKINARLEKAKEKYQNNEKFQNFIGKYTEQQLRHMEILKNMEGNVPEKTRQRIQEQRQEHLDRFSEVMNKLQNREQLQQRLEQGLKNQEQNQERQMRRLEIIEELENTTELKAAIKQFRQENQANINTIRAHHQQTRANLKEYAEMTRKDIQVSIPVDGSDAGQETGQVTGELHQVPDAAGSQPGAGQPPTRPDNATVTDELKTQVQNRLRNINTRNAQ